MRRFAIPSLRTAIALVTALGGAILLAYQQSRHDQETRATVLVSEVSSRAGDTSDQLLAAYEAFTGVVPVDACLPASILKMRRIVMASPYLGGFGYVEGNNLICSSIGAQDGPIDLGAPDYISALGYAQRKNRELAIAPGTPLVVNTAPNGFSGFFIPALVLTLTDPSSGVSLGVGGYSTKELLMSSGLAQYDWSSFQLPDGVFSSSFVSQGQIFVVQRSRKWDHFTYAAVPTSAANAEFQRLLPTYLIFGLLAGIVASIVLWRLAESRKSLPALLKLALARKEIFVEFQPIVDMASGRWIGAEVLARWRRASGENVPPDVFVPLAEEHGLIGELTRTVLEVGLRDMAPFLRSRDSFFMTFNVSAADLRDRTVVQHLEMLIEQHGLRPKNVHLEITERQMMDSAAVISTVTELRSKGFEVGTDDFGVGCSNLGYLNSIPLDYVKIDRSFMVNSIRGYAPVDIIETIVRLAKAREIRIIAEGVETEDQRSDLLELGVDVGQGWLFGKSMRQLDFIAKLATAGSGDTLNTAGEVNRNSLSEVA